jgi:hypothetical protein
MANKLGKAKEAAFQFFKTANPEDEFFLIGFNERAQINLAPKGLPAPQRLRQNGLLRPEPLNLTAQPS